MPVLSTFYGIIVRMYREVGGKHNLPHIHAEYSGQEMPSRWMARYWRVIFLRAK